MRVRAHASIFVTIAMPLSLRVCVGFAGWSGLIKVGSSIIEKEKSKEVAVPWLLFSVLLLMFWKKLLHS